MSDFGRSRGSLVITHRLHFEPSRSMKSITGDVQTLLDGIGDEPRRSCALLASELIAQIIGREPHWGDDPVGLTIQRRPNAVRLQATGPASNPRPRSSVASAEPLAGWGQFIIDRLADRWGVAEGDRRDIWAEVEV
jgi:hypothetical protein